MEILKKKKKGGSGIHDDWGGLKTAIMVSKGG